MMGLSLEQQLKVTIDALGLVHEKLAAAKAENERLRFENARLTGELASVNTVLHLIQQINCDEPARRRIDALIATLGR